MSSYLSEPELQALQASTLHRDTPFLIRYVSQTQFSIARHYGGAKYNGSDYTYIPTTDELIRDDVLKFVTTLRKPVKKPNVADTAKTKSLWEGCV